MTSTALTSTSARWGRVAISMVVGVLCGLLLSSLLGDRSSSHPSPMTKWESSPRGQKAMSRKDNGAADKHSNSASPGAKPQRHTRTPDPDQDGGSPEEAKPKLSRGADAALRNEAAREHEQKDAASPKAKRTGDGSPSTVPRRPKVPDQDDRVLETGGLDSTPPPTTSVVAVEERDSAADAAGCGGKPLPAKERWSCRYHPENCAVMYQSFVLKPSLLERLLHTKEGDEILWMTIFSALSFKKHYPEIPVLLATNYPPGFVESLIQRAIASRDIKRSFFHDQLGVEEIRAGRVFHEILHPPTTKPAAGTSSPYGGDNKKWSYLLKADAMGFARDFRSKYKRLMFLDGDTIFRRREIPLVVPGRGSGGSGGTNDDSSNSNTNNYNIALDSFLTKGRCSSRFDPSKGVKKNSPSLLANKHNNNQTSPTTSASSQHHNSADLFDAFDSLNFYDLALVPEFASFHHLGYGLYYPFYNMTRCETPFEHVKEERMPILNSMGEATGKFSLEWKGCHYKYHTRYETQYNTGLVAYRNDECTVDHFMARWSRLHREVDLCRNDKTAWDQCSFPIALRESNVRVGQLPEPFNVREALGKGCSRLLYPKPRALRYSQASSSSAVVMDHDGVKEEIMRKILFQYKVPTWDGTTAKITKSTKVNADGEGGEEKEESSPATSGSSSLIACKGLKGGHWDAEQVPCAKKWTATPASPKKKLQQQNYR